MYMVLHAYHTMSIQQSTRSTQVNACVAVMLTRTAEVWPLSTWQLLTNLMDQFVLFLSMLGIALLLFVGIDLSLCCLEMWNSPTCTAWSSPPVTRQLVPDPA